LSALTLSFLSDFKSYNEINDFRRAVFRNRGPVSIAYNFMTRDSAQSDEVLFRGGLTKTEVVHQPGDNG